MTDREQMERAVSSVIWRQRPDVGECVADLLASKIVDEIITRGWTRQREEPNKGGDAHDGANESIRRNSADVTVGEGEAISTANTETPNGVTTTLARTPGFQEISDVAI